MGFRLVQLIVGLLLCLSQPALAISWSSIFPWSKACEPDLVPKYQDDQQAFDVFVQHLGTFYPEAESDPGFQTVKYYVLPNERWKSDLIIVGLYSGANEGRSALLNALPAMLYNHGKPADEQDPTYMLDQPITESGSQAGLTKRPVITLSSQQHGNATKEDLFERFPNMQPSENAKDATNGAIAGPVYYDRINLPSNVGVAEVPNVTSGDPRVSTVAKHLSVAERTLASTDVMMVLLDMKSYDDVNLQNSIRHTFKQYGRKQLILSFQDERNVSPEEAEAYMNLFAQKVYDLPLDQTGTPIGVIAKYVMPRNPLVREKKAHVELVPLAGAPEFVDLLNILGLNSKKYKHAAMRVATENFRADVADKVRLQYKQLLATQIYREGIEAATYAVIQDHIARVPLQSSKDKRWWREALEARRDAWVQALNRAAEVVGWPETGIAGAFRKLGSLEGGPKLNLFNSGALERLQNQLNSRYLVVIENPDGPNRRRAGDQLRARLETFYRHFPEERSNEDCKASPGHLCLHLPRRELLTAAARLQIERFTHASPSQLTKDVSEKQKLDLESSSDEVIAALDEIKKARGIRAIGRDFIYDVTSVGSFLGLFSVMYANAGDGGFHTLLALVFAHGTARVFRFVGTKRRDEDLEPRLNAWYRQVQLDVYDRVFHDNLLSNIFDALKPRSGDDVKALGQMQDALHYLNPELPQYPAELTEKVTPAK